MKSADRWVEKYAVLERHLARVQELLPGRPEDLLPMTTESDGIVLHLWQAVQTTLDLALRSCAERKLGTPPDHAGAFRLLAAAGVIEEKLTSRLRLAVGFRNAVAHGYDQLDLARV